MKNLLIAVLILFGIQACAQDQDPALASITYEASSRGLFHHIKINSEKISIQKKRGLDDRHEVSLSKKDWEAMTKIIKTLPSDVGAASEITTEKLWVDAAIKGKLTFTKKITRDSVVLYLDHSNPPAELKPLIDRILSLSESVE